MKCRRLTGNRNWLKCFSWNGERWPRLFPVLSFSYILFFLEIPFVPDNSRLSVYPEYYYSDCLEKEFNRKNGEILKMPARYQIRDVYIFLFVLMVQVMALMMKGKANCRFWEISIRILNSTSLNRALINKNYISMIFRWFDARNNVTISTSNAYSKNWKENRKVWN